VIPVESDRPDYVEVFMPHGDLEAARRLAVVFLEPVGGFANPLAKIAEAFFFQLSHLQVEVVPSGIGQAYVRFRSHAAREEAMGREPLMHEDVRISLEREETAGRVPLRLQVCALLWASPLATEHVNPKGIAGLFCDFGDVLEIDSTCLTGSDMSAVRAVVGMESAAALPCDVWPKKGPWGTRVVEIKVVQVWPFAQSFVDGEYRPFFVGPPPPPFLHCLPLLHGVPRALASGGATAGAPARAAGSGGRRLGRALALCLSPCFSTRTPSAPRGVLAPPPSPASVSAISGLGSSLGWISGRSTLSSVSPRSMPRLRSSLVITELPDDVDFQTFSGSVDSSSAGAERLDVSPLVPVQRRSHRLKLKATDEHVDMTSKAVALRALKDKLVGCSARLQAYVGKNKTVQAAARGALDVKAVSDLQVAALDPMQMVQKVADV
jgi:hypothetical protein